MVFTLIWTHILCHYSVVSPITQPTSRTAISRVLLTTQVYVCATVYMESEVFSRKLIFRLWHRRQVKPAEDSDATTARPGYFRAMCIVIMHILAWIGASGFAVVMCVACLIGSFILWVRGLCEVEVWRRRRSVSKHKPQSHYGKRDCPTAMAGQEDGNHWRDAWRKVAETQDYGIQRERESIHFNVDSLLKSTTGLDLEHISRVVKRRHQHWRSSTVEVRGLDM